MSQSASEAPRAEGVSAALEGPWRQGSERRWRVRLVDGSTAVLGQLLPELAQDEAVRRRYVRDAERLQGLSNWNPERVPDLPRWNSGGEAAFVPTRKAGPLARILALGPGPDPRDPGAAPPWRLREEPEGENLEALLARRAPLPVDEAIGLAAHLADGIHEVHRGGAVLRDLHPRHVVLPPGGGVRFTDVGLARVDVLSTRTAASLVLEGSPYNAPEQLYGGAVDARADLYTVGVIAWRALTGTLPFGDLPSILNDGASLPPLEQLRPGVPEGLSLLLRRCLAREVNGRPRSARELAEALRGAEPAGQPAALTVASCQGCGQAMRPGLRLCLHCGKTAVRYAHLEGQAGQEGQKGNDGQEFAIDLMKAHETEDFHRRLGGFLGVIAEGQVPSLNFLVGDSRWYSKEERKALLRTPTRLVARISRATAEELTLRLRAHGIEVDPRSPPDLDNQVRWGKRFLLAGLSLLGVALPALAVAIPFAVAGICVGALTALGGGLWWAMARPIKSGPLITLRQAPLALPAADALVARLAAAMTEASPVVHEVVSDLALLVQRLVEHRAAWLGARADLDRVSEPVAPLVDVFVQEVHALAAIDNGLRTLDEGAIVRALAASEARAEPRARRVDLLEGLDRLRTLEDERGRHLHRLLEAASLLERAVRLALDTRDVEALYLREVRLALESLE